MLDYLQSQSIEIPQWIKAAQYNSPWQSRTEFLQAFDENRLSELRQFLAAHIPQQTQFIVQRFEQALDKILLTSSATEQTIISERFYGVAQAYPPYGLYALIDYVNFKGEGVAQHEQYKGQGWGLKQVLQNMRIIDDDPLLAFVNSAQATLTKRVENSPQERNEQRWLQGWHNRLTTYLPSE